MATAKNTKAKKAAKTFPVCVRIKLKDKRTGEIHPAGTVLNVTQERYDEIMAVREDLVVKVEQPEAEKEPEPDPVENPEADPVENPEAEQPEAEEPQGE